MENNENRLVPGQGGPPKLGKLRELAYGKPPALGRPLAAAESPVSPAKPRRIRRAGPAWAGALVMGAVALAAASLLLLDRSGALESLARAASAPTIRVATPGAAGFLPDAGMGPEDKARYWARAEYDTARFASLMGARPDEPARMEENARRLERLLSER